MKEIRMDYETYKKELKNEWESGIRGALLLILEWLESTKPISEIVGSNMLKIGDPYWELIAALLDRGDEFKPKEDKEDESTT